MRASSQSGETEIWSVRWEKHSFRNDRKQQMDYRWMFSAVNFLTLPAEITLCPQILVIWLVLSDRCSNSEWNYFSGPCLCCRHSAVHHTVMRKSSFPLSPSRRTVWSPHRCEFACISWMFVLRLERKINHFLWHEKGRLSTFTLSWHHSAICMLRVILKHAHTQQTEVSLNKEMQSWLVIPGLINAFNLLMVMPWGN